MPRQSQASLSIVAASTSLPARPEPPADLNEAAAAIWRRIVASRDPRYFDVGSQNLLATLCKAQAEADRIARIVAGLDPLEDRVSFTQLTRVVDMHRSRVSQLSTRLRLTKQSQLDAKTAASQAKRDQPLSSEDAFRALRGEL